MMIPALFDQYEGDVLPEWIDANGHMNLAYYVVLFDYATDALFEAIGIGREYKAATNHGTFVAETHNLYERELLVGERVRVDYDRSAGTLVCYHRHQVNDSPYIHIGEQDITAHVNFSALHHWGLLNGLECCGFTNQAYFLRGLGIAGQLKNWEQECGSVLSEREKTRMLQTFLLDMGNKFKILIQYKGMVRPRLSGLPFMEPLA